MSETARRDTPKGGVVLIGRNDFQNKLLARLIAERIGCSCLVRSIEDLRGPSVDVNVLALLDVEGIAAPDLNARLQVLATCRSEERRVGKECRSRWSTYQSKKKRRYSVTD